mgnify:CR=1 FL=1
MLDVQVYDKLLEMLEYREDGHFYHMKDSPKRRAGDKAGYINSQGYVFLSLGAQKVHGHRAAFYATYGYLPEIIDHINGDKSDNRIGNLRECTHAQNASNAKLSKKNKTGIKGVCWHKASKKFIVQIGCKGQPAYGGIYDNLEDAKYAAFKLRQDLHGKFANHG